MSERFCNHCGHRNPDGSNFCSSCGTALVGESDDLTITLHTDAIHHDPDLVVHLRHDAVLVVRRSAEGEDAGDTFTLGVGTAVAGRHPESPIFLDDVTVSRRHASFEGTESGFVVRDLGSLNGTYVNRDRITEHRLHSGDEVQIGKFRLVFLSTQGS